MAPNILATFTSAFGDSLVRRLSSLLGESEKCMHKAIRSMGPALVAVLMQQAFRRSEVIALYSVIQDKRTDAGILRKLPTLFGTPSAVDDFTCGSEVLAQLVFGNRAGALVIALSDVSGMRPCSSLRLLSIALPVLLGILRWHIDRNDVAANEFASILAAQRHALEQAGLDQRMVDALGFGSLEHLLEALPHSVDPPRSTRRRADLAGQESSHRFWRTWLIAAGVTAAALLVWVGA